MTSATSYTAFLGVRRLVSGSLSEIAAALRSPSTGQAETVVVFADDSGHTVDLDLRNPASIPIETIEPAQAVPVKPARGRPKLGVTAREVTLLPRHWEWLSNQPGGASAALRRLVDQARRDNLTGDRLRETREAVHRVMTTLAGNLPGYEEALRTLYSGDRAGFSQRIATWPEDVRRYVQAIADRTEAPDDHAH